MLITELLMKWTPNSSRPCLGGAQYAPFHVLTPIPDGNGLQIGEGCSTIIAQGYRPYRRFPRVQLLHQCGRESHAVPALRLHAQLLERRASLQRLLGDSSPPLPCLSASCIATPCSFWSVWA